MHTLGFGFVAGIDVYDAVLVLRTRRAVEAFTRPKVSLGADVAVVAGPVGNGLNLDIGIEAAPVYSYVKVGNFMHKLSVVSSTNIFSLTV